MTAIFAWACAGCANAGGEAAHVGEAALAGTWSNAAGAHLRLEADRRMAGEGLKRALLGGTDCPDAIAGHWSFFSAPNDDGMSFAGDQFTSGDQISLTFGNPEVSCLLSALIRRDAQGLSLCLVEDPDSDCSAEELLRAEPTKSTGKGLKSPTT
ncbi:hypothetical protein ACF065_31330 [Streptomyces sp. NPDC015232]|uniref:hypothetical protein n=1 Tax=unclassified Streptomyces TaxID=2593676 RepID=UPI0036FADBC2